jgi:hypothetical protein
MPRGCRIAPEEEWVMDSIAMCQKLMIALSDEWDNTVFTTSTSAMGKNRKTEGLDGRGVRAFTAIKHKTSGE